MLQMPGHPDSRMIISQHPDRCAARADPNAGLARHPRLCFTHGSYLQFPFQFVEEAPVGALGDDLLWARLDEARLVHAQGVEADRVRSVIISPSVVRDLVKRLERVVVSRSEAPIDDPLRDASRLAGAEIRRLEDGARARLVATGCVCT